MVTIVVSDALVIKYHAISIHTAQLEVVPVMSCLKYEMNYDQFQNDKNVRAAQCTPVDDMTNKLPCLECPTYNRNIPNESLKV